MGLITVENEALRLQVLPEAGASVAGVALRTGDVWLPVLRETPPAAIAERNSSLLSSFALAPWSNRLADARFVFRGRVHQLHANTPEGYAIHGDVRKRPWRIESTSARAASFTFTSSSFANLERQREVKRGSATADPPNFPFAFDCRLDYALDGTTLTSTLTLSSRANEPMPAGIGFHPYYRRTLLDEAERVEIEACVARAYEDLVPTRPAVPIGPEQDFSRARPLGDQDFDTCFTGWDGRATITWPGSGVRARVACEPPFDHMILFAPPGKPFFALEPVSNSNNGFNLAELGDPDAGVRVLAPGEALRGVFRLTLERT